MLRTPESVAHLTVANHVQVTLGIYNWMVISGIKTNFLSIQHTLLSCTAAEDPLSMHIILLPTFAWAKGQLWLSQQLALKPLQGARVHLDAGFYVPLQDRTVQHLVGSLFCGGGGSMSSPKVFCGSLRRSAVASGVALSCQISNMRAFDESTQWGRMWLLPAATQAVHLKSLASGNMRCYWQESLCANTSDFFVPSSCL